MLQSGVITKMSSSIKVFTPPNRDFPDIKPSDELNDVLLGVFRLKQRKDKAPNNNEIMAHKGFFANEIPPSGPDETCYTCPEGKRAFFVSFVMNFYNTTGALGYVGCNVVQGGANLPEFIAIISKTLNETKVINYSPPMSLVLDAGESIRLFGSSSGDTYLSGFYYEIDAL